MRKFSVFFKFAVFIASCLFWGAAQAQEKTLAIIDEKPLMLSDISPTKAELTKAAEMMSVSRQLALSRLRHNKFAEQIIERVMDTYANQQNIETNTALVQAFATQFGSQIGTNGQKSRSVEEIATAQVRIWQIEKALYDEFGGDVIFTQQNPQYPIEAYHKLLQHFEDSGVLVYKSKEYEAMLKRMFAPPYEMKIAPEQISYERPWWAGRQVIGGSASTPSNNAVEK